MPQEKLSTVIERARGRKHYACSSCPADPDIWGVSCCEHYADWKSGEPVKVVHILQDPGGTTPQKTNKLCMVDNSKYPQDKSARNLFDLWRAAVSQKWVEADLYGTDPCLKASYATNAAFHGTGKTDEKTLRSAVQSCEPILEAQLEALKPKIIIAFGRKSQKSLERLKWLKKADEKALVLIAKREPGIKAPSGVKIFYVPHPAGRSVNIGSRRHYLKHEKEILFRLDSDNSEAVAAFRREHNTDRAQDCGMRYQLLLWLQVGAVIRETVQRPSQ